ncbi:MAG TPA: ribosomal L7Ae/L30e/S12e/Gadd45 family protein [Longimicrobiales bacterium]
MTRRDETPDAALRLLGLAARAGAIVPGTERVREAARGGRLHLALVAADASANAKDKLLPLLEARGVPRLVSGSRAALGAAVGRAPLSAVGVTDASFAGRLRAVIEAESGQSS